MVGSHSLTAGQPTITLDATANTPLTYNDLVENVKIDGQPAAVGDVPQVSTNNLPSWLTFDETSWAIGGTPPETAQSTSFAVMMEDTYSDTLNITFQVQVATRGSVFQAAFPTLDLKPGSDLSFNLNKALLARHFWYQHNSRYTAINILARVRHICLDPVGSCPEKGTEISYRCHIQCQFRERQSEEGRRDADPEVDNPGFVCRRFHIIVHILSCPFCHRLNPKVI